ASYEAIHKAENREAFRQAMWRIGLKTPESFYARTTFEAEHALNLIGFPVIVRPSFTMGGSGGNIAYNREEFEDYVEWGLKASPVGEILVERSILGWKEFELEVMRDIKDNVVIVCSIENFDPMGIHTGDSITVAPAQTLTDKEYQVMRDAAIAIIREIGVDTGGSNIQFGVNPGNGEMVVIEMNPRVSRSSALASKATGFPIAKIAAKLAVGYTLDEIKNDITKVTPVSFEPTIDYVVVKIPRFAFEKFPNTDTTLTTQMKSVGEAMAIGRTFKESMQKAIRSLEIDSYGFEERIYEKDITTEKKRDIIVEKLKTPNWERIWFIADAIRSGMGADEIGSLTGIDPWFINNIREIVETEAVLEGSGVRGFGGSGKGPKTPGSLNPSLLKQAKEYGFSDVRIAGLIGK
ncbi:MAG: carbamoyl-phosphate synthase large subunit, partial [Nitrospirota bacterium]